MLGAALAAGMLTAVPAQAASGGGLVQIVSPADGADIHASTVPVIIKLRPGARPPTLKVLLDSQDVTARFHRHGRTVQGVVTRADGLLDGNNVLIAKVTGPAGARSAAHVTFRAGELLGDQALLPPTIPLESRVLFVPGQYPNYGVRVGDITYHNPQVFPDQWCQPGNIADDVWVLALNRATTDEVSSVVMPLCTDQQTAALGTYLGSLPNTDMVIVNKLGAGGAVPVVNGLGKAMAKIGAVQPEFEQIGGSGDGNRTYSVVGIPGLPPGQAYQAGGLLTAEQRLPYASVTDASINATLVQDNYQNYTLDMRDYVTFSVGGGTDLRNQGNITIGGRTYRPDPAIVSQLLQDQAAGKVAGGFHVLILDRRTLDPIPGWDRTYATTAGAGPSGAAQAAMASDLDKAAQDFREGALVLVASLGNPMAGGQATGIAAPTIAQALAPYGGTPDVINSGAAHSDASNWPYALVGALSPPAAYGLRPFDAPEASPAIHARATGEVDGALQRGTRGMWYGPAGWNSPYLVEIQGQTQVTTQNYGLYQAIGQAPTPWPVPTPGPDYAGELAAYQYLSQRAMCGDPPTADCHPDIRSYYYSGEKEIAQWQDEINAATNPGTYTNPHTGVTTKISQTEFDAVQNQLGCTVDDKPPCSRLGELADVLLVDGLRDNMHTLLTDSSIGGAQALNDAYTNVSAVIEPPPGSEVGSALYDILEILQSLADVASLAAHGHAPAGGEPEGNGISEAIGLVAAVLGAANDLYDNKTGALQDQLQTTVGNLKQQTSDNFTNSLTMLDETFGEILSDWGRLSFVANGLFHGQGSWDVGAKEGQIITDMNNAMEIGYYKALIPLVYVAQEDQNLQSPDPAKWCDIHGDCPFAESINGKYELGISAYSYPVNNPKDSFSPAFDVTVVGQDPILVQTDGGQVGNTPFSPDLMTDLEKAGYYPGWFFQRFPLHRTICAPGDSDPFSCFENG